MNGPEHYRTAERLLAEDKKQPATNKLAHAHIHAILAQTAAALEVVASRGPGDLSEAWREAIQ